MYNKVFLIGNLARDPEVRYTPAGIAVARMTIAVNRPKKKDGSEQEADFLAVVAWRRLAEICGEYMKKGKPVAVEGRLQVRSFVGRDGKNKTMVEVVADSIQMLGKKPEEKEGHLGEKAQESLEKAEEAPF